MYTPSNMQMTGDETIAEFIAENSFGLVISSDLQATHLPFVFVANEGEKGVLYAHFAKANKHWQTLDNENVLVVFTGPHAYISPSWYEHTPAAPTWNYSAVHCYGRVELLDEAGTKQAIDKLVAKHEPALLDDKERMPDDFQQKLRQAVVAFKVIVDDIQAKEKLGQHRKVEDQQNTYATLQESDRPDAMALSKYMQKRRIGTGE
jgi:transcriptional regulator